MTDQEKDCRTLATAVEGPSVSGGEGPPSLPPFGHTGDDSARGHQSHGPPAALCLLTRIGVAATERARASSSKPSAGARRGGGCRRPGPPPPRMVWMSPRTHPWTRGCWGRRGGGGGSCCRPVSGPSPQAHWIFLMRSSWGALGCTGNPIQCQMNKFSTLRI